MRTKCETEKAAGYDARVALVARGKYFRLVAEVLADGENLSDVLLAAGLAWPYDGGKRERIFCTEPVKGVRGRLFLGFRCGVGYWGEGQSLLSPCHQLPMGAMDHSKSKSTKFSI